VSKEIEQVHPFEAMSEDIWQSKLAQTV
jgi:hypothetical protein